MSRLPFSRVKDKSCIQAVTRKTFSTLPKTPAFASSSTLGSFIANSKTKSNTSDGIISTDSLRALGLIGTAAIFYYSCKQTELTPAEAA